MQAIAPTGSLTTSESCVELVAAGAQAVGGLVQHLAAFGGRG